ncbi:MAG: GH1 family beta-glucosidase [Chloroflexota bacterium]|jgi:beta-glucosidase
MSDAGHIRFPDGFLWGAATSSFQIEGAVGQDGRGPSIWDTQCHNTNLVQDGHTGDVAADHYNRWADDVDLMAELGLRSYRFSVAWPRVQPAGTGPANQPGLDFYSRLVDRLLERGITPMLTLYHWDLPQALEDAGGWPARDTADRFADYAAIVFEALRDRVGLWATLNEPWCSSLVGYADPSHAPGRSDPTAAVRSIHHLNLAHGLALEAMRAIDAGPRHGLVLNLAPIHVVGEDPDGAAADAARRFDALRNRVWTEPALRGRYPEDALEDLAAFGGLPLAEGDLDVIGQPLDWLGINYYNDEHLCAQPGGAWAATPGMHDAVRLAPGDEHTDMGWPITPDGLRALLVGLRDRYPDLPPVYITENGCAYDDPVVDGVCHDPRRIAYLEAHLRSLHAAIDAGVDVRGYFQWSLIDNFEWSYGYHKRFGLVHIDYDTLERTPRDSAWWYRDVIARNGLEADA